MLLYVKPKMNELSLLQLLRNISYSTYMVGFLCLGFLKNCLLTLINSHFGYLQEHKIPREFWWSKILWNGRNKSSLTRFVISMLGEPYTDLVLPPRRQERLFPNPPNTGRLSGPAELRTYNVQSFDKTGGNCFHETIKWRISV